MHSSIPQYFNIEPSLHIDQLPINISTKPPRLKTSEDFSSSHAPRTCLTFLLMMAAFSRQPSITSINLVTWKESSFSRWLLLETFIRLQIQQTNKHKLYQIIKCSDAPVGFTWFLCQTCCGDFCWDISPSDCCFQRKMRSNWDHLWPSRSYSIDPLVLSLKKHRADSVTSTKCRVNESTWGAFSQVGSFYI